MYCQNEDLLAEQTLPKLNGQHVKSVSQHKDEIGISKPRLPAAILHTPLQNATRRKNQETSGNKTEDLMSWVEFAPDPEDYAPNPAIVDSSDRCAAAAGSGSTGSCGSDIRPHLSVQFPEPRREQKIEISSSAATPSSNKEGLQSAGSWIGSTLSKSEQPNGQAGHAGPVSMAGCTTCGIDSIAARAISGTILNAAIAVTADTAPSAPPFLLVPDIVAHDDQEGTAARQPAVPVRLEVDCAETGSCQRACRGYGWGGALAGQYATSLSQLEAIGITEPALQVAGVGPLHRLNSRTLPPAAFSSFLLVCGSSQTIHISLCSAPSLQLALFFPLEPSLSFALPAPSLLFSLLPFPRQLSEDPLMLQYFSGRKLSQIPPNRSARVRFLGPSGRNSWHLASPSAHGAHSPAAVASDDASSADRTHGDASCFSEIQCWNARFLAPHVSSEPRSGEDHGRRGKHAAKGATTAAMRASMPESRPS